MSSGLCTSAERLADKGFGVLLHRLVQTLLSLKVRPANPIEWLLRKLKDNDFYCDERGLSLFLSNAITTAANRSERSAPAPTPSNPSVSRRSSLLSQLMVSVLCDFSVHYRELHDGRLMAEETLLNFSRMLADFLMWEEISHQSIEPRLNPIQRKAQMLLSQYVLYAGNALKMAEQLRQYCLPRKQVQADLTVVDAIFDLTEVLLKLRCFAAQSEVDALGDEIVQFPPSLGCTDDGVDLGLSIASKRPFRLVFILPFAASRDGLVPCSQLTSSEVLERLFSLVERFASSGGFPNTVIRCIATGLPANVQNSQPVMNHLQIKSVEPESSEVLRSALQPLEFLSEYVAQNRSRFVTAENVSVIPPHFAVVSQFSGTPRPPPVPLEACKCKSRLCRTLCTYCAWDGSMEAKGDRLADVAPPCVVLLPVPGTTVVLSAPTIVVVGMCIAEHLSKALFSSVPTFQPATVSATTASSPAAAAESEKKKKAKTDKADGGKQAPPPPLTATVSGGGPPAAASPEDAPPALSQQQARRLAFGPAFDILFEGLEAPPDQAPPADSFFVVALKPLAGVKKSKTQTVAATLLSLALSDCLRIHIGTAKPILNYSLPFVGAVCFSWSAALERHASENCWWAECLFETCLPCYNTVIPDAPLAKCCLVLRSAFNTQPTLKYATALVDQYKTLSTVEKTHDESNNSSQDAKKPILPSHVHAPLLPFTSIVSCFVVPSPTVPIADEGKSADGKNGKAAAAGGQSPTVQGTPQQKASAIWSQTRQFLDAKYTAAKAKDQLNALNDALFNILSLVKDDHTLIEICTAISKLQ